MRDGILKMINQAQVVIDALIKEGKEPPYWATRQKELAESMLTVFDSGGDTRYCLNELIVLNEKYKAEIERDTAYPH